jgi:hypothetical protein
MERANFVQKDKNTAANLAIDAARLYAKHPGGRQALSLPVFPGIQYV